MRKVFVSGCYDILNEGHVQFLGDARALGDHLTVSVASDEVLKQYKGHRPSLPLDNKLAIIAALGCVDKVVPSSNLEPVFDFRDCILKERPDILAVTEDDRHQEEKKRFCAQHGIELVVLPKRNRLTRVSPTGILTGVRKPARVPLRVDFAGGWLGVPRLARDGGYIVNCAIQPLVALEHWPYEIGGGLGGSAAKAILEGRHGVRSELTAGVGWQDPAVIQETGLCVWKSGPEPVLEAKLNPDWLEGKMLLFWTGGSHHTPDFVDRRRDYDAIFEASCIAKQAAERCDLARLVEAIERSYAVQLDEGMDQLPDMGSLARKYLGGGHGGYALYIYPDRGSRLTACSERTKAIEPYLLSPAETL
jgi:cytidyltransferase-like protein